MSAHFDVSCDLISLIRVALDRELSPKANETIAVNCIKGEYHLFNNFCSDMFET